MVKTMDIQTFLLSIGGELTASGLIGFAAGYTLKKIAKIIVIGIGLFTLVLELLSLKGIVAVNYDTLNTATQNFLGSLNGFQTILQGEYIILGTTFVAGLGLGLQKG